jgi:hypothetical protein
MSAPVSHDPLVVNTQDGSCWMRRHLTRDGHGLYALAGAVAGAPDSVLARYVELREMGLASVAYAMPMPVGSTAPDAGRVREELFYEELETSARLRLALESAQRGRRVQRDRIDGLESTNAALRDRLAVLEGQRAALAERLRAGQTWRQGRLVSEDTVSQSELREIFGIPLAAPLDGVADGIARLTVPLQALREAEPEAPYVSRQLPPRDAVCARPGCGHSGADHHHGDTKCWAHLPRVRNADLTWSSISICECSGFVAGPVGEDVTPQVAKLRDLLAGQRAAVEDPHDGPLAHTYRVPRDLPPLDGAR